MTGLNSPKSNFRMLALSVTALTLAVSSPALAASAPPAQTSQAGTSAQAQTQPPLTFPPASDCAFLGGDAGKRCEARRAGAEDEYARVRSGETKLAPGVPSSSGGEFTPLSNGGSLGGFSESPMPAPSEEPAPETRSFSPNSIGNPWAGTPYDNGTGMPPR
ncbi:MAG TPA: hypothetical protein VM639_24100 [Dongiaceae bacterium]|nr:hypothetical protein [Dongiaceae bacterium]